VESAILLPHSRREVQTDVAIGDGGRAGRPGAPAGFHLTRVFNLIMYPGVGL